MDVTPAQIIDNAIELIRDPEAWSNSGWGYHGKRCMVHALTAAWVGLVQDEVITEPYLHAEADELRTRVERLVTRGVHTVKGNDIGDLCGWQGVSLISEIGQFNDTHSHEDALLAMKHGLSIAKEGEAT